MRIVIPGGSGQVGHLLARHFPAAGTRRRHIEPTSAALSLARSSLGRDDFVSNADFLRALRKIGTPPVCTESELVLKSRCVVPARLLAVGSNFRLPEWHAARATW